MSNPIEPLEISPGDVAGLLRGTPPGNAPLLLDCRTKEEHAFARIGGEALIPMNEVAERLIELGDDRDRPIIVYCHTGVRSLAVTRFLRERGFDRARSLAGGIDRWSREVDPAVPRY